MNKFLYITLFVMIIAYLVSCGAAVFAAFPT